MAASFPGGTLDKDRHSISICQSPAAILALSSGHGVGGFPSAGYTISAFLDDSDRTIPKVGYMPGRLTWELGEWLKSPGVITH